MTSRLCSIWSSPNWRLRQKSRKVMPKIVSVTFERDGFEPWVLNVLLERDYMAPAMEFTAANFDMLFRLVDHDLVHGSTRRERYGATRVDKPAPRGPREARQYFVKDRWVTKIPLEGQEVSSRKRFRTLKTRKSDETTVPKRRSGGASASASGYSRGGVGSCSADPTVDSMGALGLEF